MTEMTAMHTWVPKDGEGDVAYADRITQLVHGGENPMDTGLFVYLMHTPGRIRLPQGIDLGMWEPAMKDGVGVMLVHNARTEETFLALEPDFKENYKRAVEPLEELNDAPIDMDEDPEIAALKLELKETRISLANAEQRGEALGDIARINTSSTILASLMQAEYEKSQRISEETKELLIRHAVELADNLISYWDNIIEGKIQAYQEKMEELEAGPEIDDDGTVN